MKKILAFGLALVMCLSMSACGKSEAVTNTETKIGALTSDSTYQEIHEAYELYRALPEKEREDVENISLLSEYCDIQTGHFPLTAEILLKMSEEIEDAEWHIYHHFSAAKLTTHPDWNDFGNVKQATVNQNGDYEMEACGTLQIQDK